MKYQVLTKDQRQKILSLRQMGYTFHSISEKLMINLKTVQSVKQIERKRSNYESLINCFINYYWNCQQLWEETLFNVKNEKQRKKKLKKLLKSEATNPQSQEIKQEISRLENNGRCQKQFSRRILDEITEKVHEVIKKRREIDSQEFSLETEKSLSETCAQLLCSYNQDSQMFFEESSWIPLDY